jgi:aminoglycoside phosphotransferase (APT) family kinase protein
MDYLNIIVQLKTVHPLISKENFMPAQSGTIHKVFLSNNFVIRFRENNQEILIREKELLEKINHPLIPRILAAGNFDSVNYMIENRLIGENIDKIWKNLSFDNQNSIIDSIIDLLKFLRTQKSTQNYSIQHGKSYENFYEYFTDNLDYKIEIIQKFSETQEVIEKISKILKNPLAINLFKNSEKTLVHGDLIFHNLLTDQKTLTGLIDWEYAMWGDPDYDIFRLMNFKISAKAYQAEGQDEDNEVGYLDMLLEKIQSSGVIKDKINFKQKYEIARASYYLNALFWDAQSKNPQENIKETLNEVEAQL